MISSAMCRMLSTFAITLQSTNSMPRLLVAAQLPQDGVRRADQAGPGRRQHAAFDLARVTVGIEGENRFDGGVECFVVVLAERHEWVQPVAHLAAGPPDTVVHVGNVGLDAAHSLVDRRGVLGRLHKPPVAVFGDEITAAVAGADGIDFRRGRRGRFEEQLAVLDFVELARI